MRARILFLALALSACSSGTNESGSDAATRATGRDSGAGHDSGASARVDGGTNTTSGGISDSGLGSDGAIRFDGGPKDGEDARVASSGDAATSSAPDAATTSLDTDASASLVGARATIDGRRLMLGGVPYEIRGVCWNPIARGRTQPADFAGYASIDAPLMRAAGINTVRTYDAIRDRAALDTLLANGVRVIQTVYAWGGASEDSALEHVRATMDHDAILAWVVGNEWNYNGLYTGLSFTESRDRLERIAAAIQRIDSRPVITIYGEVPNPDTIAAMPSIDMWGLNVYRGASFGDLFTRWQGLSGKPMFLSEYGADAWDARDGGSQNLDAQAYATRVLTEALIANSSARNSNGITAGGTIFEWADEWWKDQSGSTSVHDVGGVAPGGGPYPDSTFNEEWWGIVDIDRHTRPAYTELQNLYTR